MAVIDQIPAIVRILFVFLLVLLAIRMRFSLGNSLLLGSLFLGFLFHSSASGIAASAFLSLTAPKTIALAVVVMLILIFSHSMEAGGQMQRLLDSFRGLIAHPGLNIILFPALIGLLPMPGGAIFSAPMVKNLGQQHRLGAASLSYVNYWFRHIWEYWWPLYPGVLLTTTIAGLNLWHYVLFLLPLTFVALTAGYWPMRMVLRQQLSGQAPDRQHTGQSARFARELTPIMLAIGLGLVLGIFLSYLLPAGLTPVAKELGLIVALLLATAVVWHANRLQWEQVRSILFNPKLFEMFYMVASILIFKGILEDSQAIKALSDELVQWKIPLAAITVFLPLIVGAIAGITIAFVGTTFPVLISLIQALGQEHLMLAYLMLATVGGFIGVLLSPLHLCLLLSNEYFDTTLTAVYRHLRLPCLALLISGILYFLLGIHFL